MLPHPRCFIHPVSSFIVSIIVWYSIIFIFRYSININFLEPYRDAVFIGENIDVEPQIFDETHMGATATTTGPDFCMEFITNETLVVKHKKPRPGDVGHSTKERGFEFLNCFALQRSDAFAKTSAPAGHPDQSSGVETNSRVLLIPSWKMSYQFEALECEWNGRLRAKDTTMTNVRSLGSIS